MSYILRKVRDMSFEPEPSFLASFLCLIQNRIRSSDTLVEQADGLMANSETVARESEELTTSAEELKMQIQTFKV